MTCSFMKSVGFCLLLLVCAPSLSAIRGTTERVVVKEVKGNVITTTDGRKLKTDARKGYVKRSYFRENQLKGKELKIRHVGTDSQRKYEYIFIEEERYHKGDK